MTDHDQPTLEPDHQYEVEEIEHDPPATVRSLARRVALQVLYELDVTNHVPGHVIEARLLAQNPDDEAADRNIGRYVRLLVHGVLDNKDRVDRVIAHFAVEFPLDQLAIVDRNILRMALFEFAVSASVPISVAIDEAVALARLFGADNTTTFVNGVLGQIAQRGDELRAILDESVSGETEK